MDGNTHRVKLLNVIDRSERKRGLGGVEHSVHGSDSVVVVLDITGCSPRVEVAFQNLRAEIVVAVSVLDESIQSTEQA